MATTSLQHLDHDLAVLADAGLDSHAFRHEAMARLRRAIRIDAFCFSDADPDSLVMTAAATEGVERSASPLVYANEHHQTDFAKHADLARGRRPARILAVETGGDLTRSPRYRDLLVPLGIEHELRAAAIEQGTVWGFVHLYRRAGTRGFDADELDLVGRVAHRLAAGVRAANLAPAVDSATAESSPALVVLDAQDQPVLAAGAAAEWLVRLRDPQLPDQPVPEVLMVLVAWARRLARMGSGESAQTRMRSADGAWWRLNATCTSTADGLDGQVAIIVSPASAPDLAGLRLRGMGLTAGEAEVTEGVLRGASTKEIAGELVLSPYTVQDRLKRVFEKAGVRSRRELVALVHAAGGGSSAG